MSIADGSACGGAIPGPGRGCQSCPLRPLCLPGGLAAEAVERLDALISRGHPLHRGDRLFQGRDPFHALFVVRTGSIMRYIPCRDGGEQVLDFYLPGEMIGLDAIDSGHHRSSTRVLETSATCEVPFGALEALAEEVPALQHRLYRLLSREISRDHRLHGRMNSGNAEERLAAFLLNISDRLRNRGFSSREFYLSMSRNEIASYLGLAVETVSRLFTRFHEEGLLDVERKHLELIDIEGLRRRVERCASEER